MSYNSNTMQSRTNEAWLSDLRNNGTARDAALEDLRVIIQKGLPYALSRWLSPDQPQFNALIDEVTQETLLRVLDQLDTFEGRSRFTTWAYKFAILQAATEVRRQAWTGREVALLDLDERPDPRDDPARHAEAADLASAVRRAMTEVLTPYQRKVALRDMHYGWAACVWVNDKNSAGAYSGFYPMVFFFRHEKIVQVNGGPDDFGIGAQYARNQCEQLGAPFKN